MSTHDGRRSARQRRGRPRDLAGAPTRDDFAITEDCFDQNWCHEMSPFVDQNNSVLAAEYTDTGAKLSRFCPKAQSLGFDAILKKRNLGAWRRSC